MGGHEWGRIAKKLKGRPAFFHSFRSILKIDGGDRKSGVCCRVIYEKFLARPETDA